MVYVPTLLKLPENECPEIWMWIPPRRRRKSWNSLDDPVVSLQRNLYGRPSGRSSFGEKMRRRESTNMGMFVCSQIAWFMLVGLRGRYQHCLENTKPQTHVDLNTKGVWCSTRDNAKHDGNRAVVAEQSSPAPQMAAKFLVTIPNLLDVERLVMQSQHTLKLS